MSDHAERIRLLQEDMEAAMRHLEDWQHPLEIHVHMLPVFSAWGLLHGLIIQAYYAARDVDEGRQTISVPREHAIAASDYAKSLTESGVAD